MISLNPTTSNLLNFNPFHQSQKPQLPIQIRRPNVEVRAASAGVGSGFLSAIGRAIEEEEYRKARAEVQRKGFDLQGYSVEGLSIGGHETCVIVPELKSAFDIGRCPSKAVQQNFLFITHAHLDHIVCLFLFYVFHFLAFFSSLGTTSVFFSPGLCIWWVFVISVTRTMSVAWSTTRGSFHALQL